MQDWSKFAWKKGDVLTDEERFVVFKGFNTDDYTEFSASFEYEDGTCRQNLWFVSNDFRKVSDNIAQEIIKKIEEHYGCKLNLETLEIEHTEPKQEFKDGDILFYENPEDEDVCSSIFIFRGKQNHTPGFLYHAVLDSDGFFNAKDGEFEIYEGKSRLATDSEKQQLFSALEKEGKRWNPDTKSIEDLPKKCEFKPFDKVLARNSDAATWIATLFGFYDRVFEGYVCIGDVFEQCIPYNEETKHLLGTTDEWKGGEQ